MDSKLQEYLKKFPPATVDTVMLDPLRQGMKDAVLEIMENIRRCEKLAVEARFGLTEVNARLDALEKRLDTLQERLDKD